MANFSSLVDKREAARIENLSLALTEKAPPWAAKYLQKASRPIGFVVAGVEAAVPHVIRLCIAAYELWKQLPTRAAGCLCGLGICFFGGRYAVSIAAIEAFRTTGGSQMYMWIKDLHEETKTVLKANAEDDDATVKEGEAATNAELLQRKTALVLRTVDPERISAAVSGLWTGYMGVLAVLHFRFAKTAALANSIGDYLRPVLGKVVAPTVVAVTPPDYRRWISPAINIACKSLAMYAAWKIQFVLSAVQSAINGGHIVSQNLLPWLRELGYLTSMADGLTDEVVSWSISGCGIYHQLVRGGSCPFPLSMCMWPMDILERWLQWSVTYFVKEDAINK